MSASQVEESDRRVRKFVFDYFLSSTFAPSLEEMARGCSLGREQTLAALLRLESGRHLKMLPGTERLLMAFPFSAVATPYRVTRPNQQRYFANCAWDAVAFYPMLKEPVTIDSFCHHCGDDIHFQLPGAPAGKPEGTQPIVHLTLPASEWWADIVLACSNTMVFFESEAHLEAWNESDSMHGGASLTLRQVVQLSEPIYSRRLELDYARPSRAELQAHFDRMGLTGDFWRLK